METRGFPLSSTRILRVYFVASTKQNDVAQSHTQFQKKNMLISNAEVCCFLSFVLCFFNLSPSRQDQDDIATRHTRRDHRIIYNFHFHALNAKIQMRCVIDAPPFQLYYYFICLSFIVLSLPFSLSLSLASALPLSSFNFWYSPPGSDTRRCDESLFYLLSIYNLRNRMAINAYK